MTSLSRVQSPTFGLLSAPSSPSSSKAGENVPMDESDIEGDPLKPDLGAFDNVAARPSAGPPPTPFKENTRRTLTPFVKKRIDIVEEGTIFYRGLPFKLLNQNAQGRFKTLYSVRGFLGLKGRIRLVTGIPNSSIYVKAFRLDLLKREPCKKIESYHSTSHEHHGELLAENFPITAWYNYETALEDGFDIVEGVVVFKPELYWDASTSLQNLSADAKKYLKEIRDLFILSFRRKSTIPNDLQGNLGFNAQGKLVLDDFTEFVEGKKPYAFRLIARGQLEWFAIGNPGIYQYLLSSVLHSNIPDAIDIYQRLNRDPEKRVIDFDHNFNPIIILKQETLSSSTGQNNSDNPVLGKEQAMDLS